MDDRWQLQIALDCADPHAQADFWAAALGYRVDRNPERIRGLVASGVIGEDDLMTLPNGDLVFRDADAMVDPDGVRPRWYFQRVPEPKTVKNRMHVDLRVPLDRRAEEIARLERLGAQQLYECSQGPSSWVTMADPEGNEFCVD